MGAVEISNFCLNRWKFGRQLKSGILSCSMTELSLSGILLFALVVPFIMTYRIGPGETPYWLFGIIFALLLGYLVSKKFKNLILWLVIFLVIGGAYFSAILVRHQTAPTYQIHDMVLQQEAAIRFLLEGKNPYAMTYFNTPLELWHYSDKEVNPALFHFALMPWYLIFSLPFYLLSISFFGFFDGRMSLLVLFLLTLILAWKLLKAEEERRRLFLVLLAFNPATLGYFLEGRSDFFVFAFLFLGFYCLGQNHYTFAAIPMGLALATKQSAWPIVPLYLGYLWLQSKRDWRLLTKQVLPLILTLALVILPFFIWSPKAFLESTVFYLSGNALQSYPVAGYGWGMILKDFGIIKDKFAYYPFWIWQLVTCGPLLIFLWRWLVKKPEISRLIAAYGILTMFFWYFSRYFNNSHLGYLSMVFISAYFWPKNGKV